MAFVFDIFNSSILLIRSCRDRYHLLPMLQPFWETISLSAAMHTIRASALDGQTFCKSNTSHKCLTNQALCVHYY